MIFQYNQDVREDLTLNLLAYKEASKGIVLNLSHKGFIVVNALCK